MIKNNQTNKKTKKKKKNKTKQKQKQKQKQKRARSTDLRSTALFFTLQQPSSFKMTAVEMASRTVFHQPRSHDLFWKGVGPPQKQWTFWTKKLFKLTFLGPQA